MAVFYRPKYILETSFLGLADGLDIESKGKKEIKMSMLFYMKNCLDGCVIYCKGENLGRSRLSRWYEGSTQNHEFCLGHVKLEIVTKLSSDDIK